jgi:beta-glucosidase-like glycosyl hydrolase
VILFERNVESLSQVSELIASTHERLAGDGLPPLIMADHEGDFVAELRSIIGAPPSALAIAATGDLGLARDVARETGKAMRKIGINVVLAPVADLFTHPSSPITGLRTFGYDPERVGEFVAASVAGYSEAGIASCIKHFPGHGDTAEDSHETLPEVKRSADQLFARELVPFRHGIEAGAQLVMMSHVAYPMGGDELVPASFDRRLIEGLLRRQLGFGGVVITDALEMAGARWYAQGRFGGLSGGFERSLLAGADLLLHTRPIPEQLRMEGESQPVMSLNVMETIIRTLEKVVDRGRIDEKLAEAASENEPLRNILDILERSASRVGRLRGDLPAEESSRPVPSRGKVIEFNAYPTVPPVYRDVAALSIAAPGGWPEGSLELEDAPVLLVPVEWSPGAFLKSPDLDGFLDVLCKRFPRWRRSSIVTGFSLDGDTATPVFGAGERLPVVDASRYAGTGPPTLSSDPNEGEVVVVVLSARGEPAEDFRAGLQRFAEEFQPAAAIVTGWPIVDWVPPDTPTLLTLGTTAQVGSAVAEIVTGAVRPQGRLSGLLPQSPDAAA